MAISFWVSLDFFFVSLLLVLEREDWTVTGLESPSMIREVPLLELAIEVADADCLWQQASVLKILKHPFLTSLSILMVKSFLVLVTIDGSFFFGRPLRLTNDLFSIPREPTSFKFEDFYFFRFFLCYSNLFFNSALRFSKLLCLS